MGEYICPECQNPIYDDDALLCHFCGGSLKRASKGAMGSVRYGRSKIIWIIMVVLVILGFALLTLR